MIQKTIKYFLFAGTCFLIFHARVAAEIMFRHVTIEDGLSNSSVLSIAQDSKGFIWLGTRDGLNRYDGSRVKIYRDFYKNNPKGPNVKINQILEDGFHNLWIATNNGLYQYDPTADKFYPILYAYTNAMILDQRKLWVGTTQGLYLIELNEKQNRSKVYRITARAPSKMPFTNALSLLNTKSGEILIGTDDGVFLLSQNKRALTLSAKKRLPGASIISMVRDRTQRYWMATDKLGVFTTDGAFTNIVRITEGNTPTQILSNNVRKLFIDDSGTIWLGTLKGLNRYNLNSKQFEAWVQKPGDPASLNYNSIYDIFQDRQRNIWVGTYYGGVNIIEAIQARFYTYKASNQANSLSSNIISGILGDASNNLWVGTEAEGLNYINFREQKITHFLNGAKPNSISSNLVKSVFRDRNTTLWIGMYNGGINQWMGSKGFKKFNTKNSGLSSDNVTCISEDGKGNLWIGHQEAGINIFDSSRKQMKTFDTQFSKYRLKNKGITCLFHDSKNRMWIGTRVGLHLMQENANGVYQFNRDLPGVIGGEYINCVIEDEQKNIWVGSASGLTRYEPDTKQFTTYTQQTGLPGSKVVGIVADDDQKLWLSTNNGLSRFDPNSAQFINYDRIDGLDGNVFNYNSFYKDAGGRIYFGSYSGLVTFMPSAMQVNNQIPGLALTSLAINGKQIKTDGTILNTNIAATNQLRLRYDQAILAIEYAVLNFVKPAKNRSAYKLVGYDRDWVFPTSHRADLQNLQPGRYLFYLKGSNNDGIWSPPLKILEIIIAPPFWRTWWAYLLYLISCLGILFGIFFFFSSRAALRRKLQYEHEMNEKQQELQKMKTDFFTHISHELRTPLTLILGPAEMLLDKVEKKRDEKMLLTIKSNAERLLHLTNSLMTLMKADSGALQLNYREANIVSLLRSVFEKFILQAQNKNIQFTFHTPVPDLQVRFDGHYLEMVITNLLSNAIKFTPQGGRVQLLVADYTDKVEIRVCDNGPGIPQQDADKIFNQYFQASGNPKKHEGSGVGLALSKKLILLHQGYLSFTSEKTGEEMQTCFLVSLKKGLD